MQSARIAGYRTKQDLVYLTLKEFILSSVLRPGERLVIRDLAAKLGVSETPIRAAITRLSSEGLVEQASHFGAVVGSVSDEDIFEIHLLVGAIQGLAAARAAARSDNGGQGADGGRAGTARGAARESGLRRVRRPEPLVSPRDCRDQRFDAAASAGRASSGEGQLGTFHLGQHRAPGEGKRRAQADRRRHLRGVRGRGPRRRRAALAPRGARLRQRGGEPAARTGLGRQAPSRLGARSEALALRVS